MGNESNHRIDGLTIGGDLAFEGVGGAKTILNRDAAGFVARQAAFCRGMGYYAEPYPAMLSSHTITVTQTVYGIGIGLLEGDVVSNLSVRVSVAGNTVTLAKLGLYSKTGTLLCSSADSGASFASTGTKTLPMTTPFTVLATDFYYAAFLGVSAVTMPDMWRASNLLAAGWGGVGVGAAILVNQTGQADLPASATLVAQGANTAWWIGVS